MKVVVNPPAFCKSENLKSKLSSIFPNTIYKGKGDYLSESELIQFLKDADAAIIGRDQVTKTALEALPQLKMISKYGVRLDNLDIASIKEKGIELEVTSGTNK
jgi:phosphoglycerate dehydrogenase-like enzyme